MLNLMMTYDYLHRLLIFDFHHYINTNYSQKPLGLLKSNRILFFFIGEGTNIYTNSFGHDQKGVHAHIF